MRRTTVSLLVMALTAVALSSGPVSNAEGLSPDVSPDVVSWHEVDQAMPPRASSASAYDTARDRIVRFGGYRSQSGLRDDTWVWDGSTWSELQPEVAPSARRQPAMAYDEVRDEIVLFGGDVGEGVPNDETWVLVGDSWEQRFPAVSPPPSRGAEMVYDPVREEAVMFGGIEFSSRTWIWDGANWHERKPAVSPAGRWVHGMAYDRTRRSVILTAGVTAHARGDTWAWNGTTWTKLVGDRMGKRSSPSMSSFGRRVLLFGGRVDGQYTADTFILRDRGWARLELQPTPPARADGDLVYDDQEREAVLIGGFADGTLNDMWVLQR